VNRARRAHRDLGVVGHEEGRRPDAPEELEHEIDELVRGSAVELARGLVGEQQPGALHERRAHRDPLLLSARELPRPRTRPTGEPGASQEILGSTPRFRVAPAGELERQLHDLADGELRGRARW